MVVKKSLDVLKQQKKSFFNFIKTNKEYSEAIADLFYDNEIEKITDMDEVKQYLEQKWVSRKLVGNIENDYISYLKSQGFYGSMEDYPDELKKSIRENDKILNKIKRNILKEYNQSKDFIYLNVKQFVDEEFIKRNKHISENFRDSWYWRSKIIKKKQEIEKLEIDIENIQREIVKTEYKIKEINWFQNRFHKKKKRELEWMIRKMKQDIKFKKEEINSNQKLVLEYKKNDEIAKNVYKIATWGKSDIESIMWNSGQYIDISSYKKAIQMINQEIQAYLMYLPNEIIIKIKGYIVDIIETRCGQQKKNLKIKIEKMLEEYLNYFDYWENKNSHSVKTVYSKNRIDPKIMRIISKLWLKLPYRKLCESTIDYNFLNDVFIHTTWFNVLDEILENWWLVSTNEAWEMGKYNQDISNSITQTDSPHRDIYFSRWYKKNGYWEHKSHYSDDYIFIANTMNNFANSGYGVPLNSEMQNLGNELGSTGHDTIWYSVISKSALNNSWSNSGFSKIDINDVYIFVSETKRKTIENNPKYGVKNANIIYFPKEYIWRMSYQLYEYIKREIEKRDWEKIKQVPIPKKIVTSEDGIKSIGSLNKWAFCDSVDGSIETSFNLIKKWDYKTVLRFLENENLNEVNCNDLYNFLIEKDDKIDGVELSFRYPKELLILIIVWIRSFRFNREWLNHYIRIVSNRLAEFGYSVKEIWILHYVIEMECDSIDIREKKRFMDWLNRFCEEWVIDFEKMKDFLIKVGDISHDKWKSDLITRLFQ